MITAGKQVGGRASRNGQIGTILDVTWTHEVKGEDKNKKDKVKKGLLHSITLALDDGDIVTVSGPAVSHVQPLPLLDVPYEQINPESLLEQLFDFVFVQYPLVVKTSTSTLRLN